MGNEVKNRRIPWLDVAKGIAILLVVFGHTVRGGVARQAVYGFHVPLFFVLSGMSAYLSEYKPDKLKRDFLGIMVPYYIWGLLSIGVYLLLGHIARDKLGVDADATLANNLYGLVFASSRTHYMRYNLPLWFLPCLFATKMVYYLLQKLLNNRKSRMFVASVLLAALGYGYSALSLPCLPFALEIAVKLLPFFVLGSWSMGIRSVWERLSDNRAAVILAGAALTALGCGVALVNSVVNYSSDYFGNIPLFLLGAVPGCCGMVLMSVGIRESKVLAYLGRNTLGILVMHKFPVLLMQIVGPFAKPLGQADGLGVVLAGVLVTAIAIGMCLAVIGITRKLCPIALGGSRKAKPEKEK